MAHHPSFGLSPANGTLLVPRSCLSAASPVDLTSSAAYSSFKSIWSTKIHDMLKPTANLLSCHRDANLASRNVLLALEPGCHPPATVMAICHLPNVCTFEAQL